MIKEIDKKLEIITNIWNDFILNYKFFENEIKQNGVLKINYYGEILHYLQDTFEIIFSPKVITSDIERFSSNIGFLQSIFIQQDLIVELLEIFGTGYVRDNLVKDSLYSINRAIRNELVGHPISKRKGKLQSSSLFSLQSKNNEIQYIIYHKENGFKHKTKTYKIEYLQGLHKDFLHKYFDIILNKLEIVLNKYSIELSKIESVLVKREFETLIELIDEFFDSFFYSDHIYSKINITKIYEQRDSHNRYKVTLDCFYSDLKDAIVDTKQTIYEFFNPSQLNDSIKEFPEIAINLISIGRAKPTELDEKSTINEYIRKLGDKRHSEDFKFYSELLLPFCQDSKIIQTELNNMSKNIFDEIEYYCSLKLIRKEFEFVMSKKKRLRSE